MQKTHFHPHRLFHLCNVALNLAVKKITNNKDTENVTRFEYLASQLSTMTTIQKMLEGGQFSFAKSKQHYESMAHANKKYKSKHFKNMYLSCSKRSVKLFDIH